MGETTGWIEFDCPCCLIDFDFDDVDGAPQWPVTTCFGKSITHAQALAACQHYEADGTPSGKTPPAHLYG
jgi:hypothetical protein